MDKNIVIYKSAYYKTTMIQPQSLAVTCGSQFRHHYILQLIQAFAFKIVFHLCYMACRKPARNKVSSVVYFQHRISFKV